MKTWTRITLTIPAEHLDAANRLAHIFDYDTGGSQTFGGCPMSPTGQEPATHYTASGQFNVEYLDQLTDPEAAMETLILLADRYGREETPQQEDVDAWCNNVIVGEPEGLQRIVEEVEDVT